MEGINESNTNPLTFKRDRDNEIDSETSERRTRKKTISVSFQVFKYQENTHLEPPTKSTNPGRSSPDAIKSFIPPPGSSPALGNPIPTEEPRKKKGPLFLKPLLVGGAGTTTPSITLEKLLYQIDIPPKVMGPWLSESLEVCEKDFPIQKDVRPVGLRQSSGAYFVHNEKDERIAILKPLDEELGEINAHTSFGMAPKSKDGVKPGTSGLREVAAHNIFPSVVPPTALVTVSSKTFNQAGKPGVTKQCSIQQIVPKAQSLFEMAGRDPAEFKDQLLPIAMVDLCLANADRNRGNILVQTSSEGVAVFPIDHGCILPSNCAAGATFSWYSIFGPEDRFSPREISIIKELNPSAGEIELRSLGLSDGEINTFNMSLLLTKSLCETTPIQEIATYFLDGLPTEGFISKSLTHSMIRIAALMQNPRTDLTTSNLGLIGKEHLESALRDVVSFIQTEKQGVETPLDTPQTMHIIQSCVRDILTDCIRDSQEKILNDSWKEEAHQLIQKSLKG